MEIKDYKKIVVIALCIGILALSIAFASISTTLYIKGSTKYTGNEWNIHFSNCDKGEVTGTAKKGRIDLKGTLIFVNGVELNLPGDSVTYEFDIVNSGKLDAELETFYNWAPIFYANSTTAFNDINAVRQNFNYTLTYDDGTQIKRGDELDSGKRKRLRLTMSYDRDVNLSTKNEVKIEQMGSTLIYAQKN